jgi:hypothetical protein
MSIGSNWIPADSFLTTLVCHYPYQSILWNKFTIALLRKGIVHGFDYSWMVIKIWFVSGEGAFMNMMFSTIFAMVSTILLALAHLTHNIRTWK